VNGHQCFENAKADFCPDGRFPFIPGRWPSGLHNESLYQATLAAPPPAPDPFPDTPIVHFGGHIWPVIHPEPPHAPWHWHLTRWEELAAQINGRCLVGVATGPNTASLAEVKALLSDRFEIFELPNHKIEGENPTFREILNRLPSGPNDVLIYAHAKGVQSARYRLENIQLWTELLYETVIFNWEVALERLAQGYKAFGSFRSFTTALNVIPHGWYYSGTFFIARLIHMQDRAVSPIWGGVEHFLGTHFPASECWLEFADARDMGQEYYMEKMYPETVMDGLNWEARRLGGIRCEYHKRELDWFLDQLRPNDRLLVIGSRQGGLEHQINRRYPDVATVSVDCNPLDGNNRRLLVGSSHDPFIKQRVRALGSFDVVFIDGDHSLAGVTEDWEFTLPFIPRFIAFHNIADTTLHRGHGCRVDLLWSRIKKTRKTREKIVGCGWGGMGVVDLEEESRSLIGPATVSIVLTAGSDSDREIDDSFRSATEQSSEVVVVWDTCPIPERYRDKPCQIAVSCGDVQKARWAGLIQANGSAVLFLDAGRVLRPGLIAKATHQLVSASQADDRVAGVCLDVIGAGAEVGEFCREDIASPTDTVCFSPGNEAAGPTLVWTHALRATWSKSGEYAIPDDHDMRLSLIESSWTLVPYSNPTALPCNRDSAPGWPRACSLSDWRHDAFDQPMTVLATVSGQAKPWSALRQWLRGLPANVKLVLCDRSENFEFSKMIRSVKWSTDAVRIYAEPKCDLLVSPADLDCGSYNRVFRELQTPFTFLIDDQLIPQTDASSTLQELTEGFAPDVAAVFGNDHSLSRYREHRMDRYVEVGGAGFSCVLARTEILQMIPQASPKWAWSDLWFWRRIQSRGYRTRLSTGTPCARSDRQLLVLCYHDIDPVERNPWTIHPDVFRSHLHELVKRGYKIATLEEAIKLNSCEQRVAVITFDDGRAGCFAYGRKILADSGVQACFYLCPGFIDGNPPRHECYSRFMDWSQIRTLAEDGHTIGSHSMTHRRLGELSSDLLRTELVKSREEIERHLRLPEPGCHHFALPYGHGVNAVAAFAEEVGYTTVVTTESAMNFYPIDLLNLSRWSIMSPCSTEQFSKDLAQLEKGTRK